MEKDGFFGIFIYQNKKHQKTEQAMDTPETIPKAEEPQISSVEQTLPPEDPIILNKLFPKAEKDLDALFPEPSMKKLLKDVIRTRQKNDRFLKRINLGKILPEPEEDE
ncbi:MAG: hypothetical protein KKH04_06425 [Proteobacteria bacterium]|nr:hypothetical protein [Pseudomonadota bacterium]